MAEDEGWKPRRGAIVGLSIAAVALAGATCWAFHINPLPTSGHPLDSGWFLTFAFVYFFVVYFLIDRVRRRRH
jgi:hypothetical protein